MCAPLSAPRGSSPLARGLRVRAWEELIGFRIIPARAGFTRRPSGPSGPPADHPRSRGVYIRQVKAAHAASGSSPLARGLPRAAACAAAVTRIIPARAGFTPDGTGRRRRPPDHPRSRGVYTSPPSSAAAPAGSSPLARGLRVEHVGAGAGGRIIPARAGFTMVSLSFMTRFSDHPRSRGVYYPLHVWRIPLAGSSPLARGLR